MYGSKKSKLSAQGSEKVETIIGKEVVIQGDLIFSGGLYIEGKVIGKVLTNSTTDSLLTLAPEGSVDGEIRASKAIISGRLQGDIYSTERIELTETAQIQGNIHYKLLEITAGATVSGQLIHELKNSESQ
ncbi:MAG TPA: polymer-forming cytoskeletal protein [Arenimonas sp.]|nr:polymer-forming cytoskeletal protein [Arenimonas sp.]